MIQFCKEKSRLSLEPSIFLSKERLTASWPSPSAGMCTSTFKIGFIFREFSFDSVCYTGLKGRNPLRISRLVSRPLRWLIRLKRCLLYKVTPFLCRFLAGLIGVRSTWEGWECKVDRAACLPPIDKPASRSLFDRYPRWAVGQLSKTGADIAR